MDDLGPDRWEYAEVFRQFANRYHSRPVDTLEVDLESKSDIDLMELGLDRYRSDPSTAILMGAYAINGGPFKHWQKHLEPMPRELVEAAEDPDVEKWAFNAQFERVMLRDVGCLDTPIKGWRCSMVLAGLQAFNGSLATVGERIELPLDKQKLKTGDKLIDMFCQPQRPTKAQPHLWLDWRTNPNEWQEFCEYNIQDCEAERAQRHRLIRYPVPAEEWELYELDQEINDRGLPVDLVFVRNAIVMSNRRKAQLTEQMKDICGLDNPGSVSQLLPWIREGGYWFNDLNKNSVAKVLAIDEQRGKTELTDECREILKLRQWQSRLSTKKYDALLKRTGPGDRLRFSYLMAGAGRTARWAGRGVQTQNLKTTPPSLEEMHVLTECNRIIRSGDYEALELFIDEPMEALTGCVRSSFRADEDEELIVCDLKSIESAMIGTETKCERLLNVFRDGKDPYKDFGSEFFRVSYAEVTRKQRGFSKPPALGCGYRLGGGELIAGKRTGLWGYAENMGQDITREDSHKAVKVFRTMYPEIPQHWIDLENAVYRTMTTHQDTTIGVVRFEWRPPYLLMWLPTGRPVFYFKPALKMRTIETGRTMMRKSRGMFEDGAPFGEMVEVPETYDKLSFTYMGANQVTRQWGRIDSHGGRTTEQETQANAREVLKRGLLKAGREGFPIVGHSHDEIIACVKKGSNQHTLAALRECMIEPLPEMPGLPLDAHGYTNSFYYKD